MARLKPEQRKRLILDAAINLATCPGLYHFSVRDVSSAAECSASLVLHHFKSVIGIRDAVIEAACEDLDKYSHVVAQAIVMRDPMVDALDKTTRENILLTYC